MSTTQPIRVIRSPRIRLAGLPTSSILTRNQEIYDQVVSPRRLPVDDDEIPPCESLRPEEGPHDPIGSIATDAFAVVFTSSEAAPLNGPAAPRTVVLFVGLDRGGAA